MTRQPGPVPLRLTVTDDPETWRAVYEAAMEARADVEMSDATIAILRRFAAPAADVPFGPLPPGYLPSVLDPAVYVADDVPDGEVRLRPRSLT